MTEDIVFSSQRHIGLITLNRVQALNALTLPMIIALQKQLSAWQENEEIHAVVIQAVPGKAFCAGGDVRWIYNNRPHLEIQMEFFWHEYRLNHFIHHFNKPYIALMDGVTMGGGVGISLHGSHPVASENFLFAMPETGIGFFPDIGASYLLSRCPGAFGVYLGLTGGRLGAGDAERLGLVKQTIPSKNFASLLEYLTEADLSINAHAKVDAALHHFAEVMQVTSIMEAQSTINACFSQSNVELIIENLIHTDDAWSREAIKNIQEKAPLALKVTLIQLQRAKNMNMADCVKLDYCLVRHFMQDHDFYEGIRALLIDKDKSPHWHPNLISQVNEVNVANYFESTFELDLI